MTKTVTKSAKGMLLYCENDSSVLADQSNIFVRAGYAVQQAQGRAAAEQALRTGRYDVVVLGHTLTKDDRHHLPYIAKKRNEGILVMVLHASGKHPAVDVAIDSRDGERAIIAALESVAELRYAVAS